MDLAQLIVPGIIAIVLIGLAGAALTMLVPVQPPPAAEPEELPLIEQPFPAGEPWEQPTPYFAAPVPESPDPLEVASNLDKKALLGTAMLSTVLVMSAAYFFIGPLQRAQGSERQLEASVHRGAEIYASLCFDCHGQRGQGLVGFTLNRPDLRATCDPELRPIDENIPCNVSQDEKTRDFIMKTVSRGREKDPPNYSMPTWSREEGGPLSLEQIRQVANFVMYGDWELPLEIRRAHNQPVDPSPPPPPKEVPPAERAKRVLQNTCITCHSIVKDRPSVNPLSPNLSQYGSQGPFSDEVKRLKAQDPENWLVRWISDAPRIKPGTQMPAWRGVFRDEVIKAISELLLSMK